MNGVVLLHVEPPESAVPTQRWRLYQVIVKTPMLPQSPLHPTDRM